MAVAFLITSPYQVYHYKWIYPHVPDPVAVIEVRERDLGLAEDFVHSHLPGCRVEEVSARRLRDLDGRFDAIVCQTPVLPLEFFDRSLVVAQQYSLAKEHYQYGVWRAHAHLNLMYGDYSVRKVQGFCHAVAVGNPLLDPYWQDPPPRRRRFTSGGGRPRILYQPTYGDLSSMRSVLPQLRHVDADITLKLHHAESTVPTSVGDHIDVVGSDADPVALLRAHDGVISDFSGAAFDAMFAGLPVVLAGTADPLGRDVTRLSDQERDHSMLAGAAAFWAPGSDLFEAFAAAELLQQQPASEELIKDALINPGHAGEACAAEIVRLLVDGEPEHFGARQVRNVTKRYVLGSRRSRVKSDSELADAGHTLPPHRPGGAAGASAVPTGVQDRLRRTYRRGRRLLARSERLRRMVRAARRWRDERRVAETPLPDTGPLPAPSPAGRREEMLQLLLPYLRDAQVPVARDSEQNGCDVAVPVAARRGLLKALHRVGAERGDLRVRTGMGAEVMDTVRPSDLRWFDMLTAEWLEFGTVRERGSYRIGFAGYLVVHFVAYDQDRNRYLTTRTRARRTDWTSVFADGLTLTAPREPLPVAEPRPAHPSAPVDVVYTWVDAGDPRWQRDHERFSAGHDVQMPSANNLERFIDREELRYSMRSLSLFAPFVRHIYLVTADQCPPWLDAGHPDVTVVPHREIFPDSGDLPTFNSHAIESCLHRIPGLSDHFLYLNDDVFLGQETTEEDFFTRAGLAKVRMSPSQFIYRGEPEPGAIPTDWAAYNSVRLVEREYGQSFDRRVMHVPLVLRKDVLADLEDTHPGEFARTRAARFRSRTDVAVPSMLAQFYGIATGRAVEWPTVRNDYLYLDTGRTLALHRLEEIIVRRPRFFCLNATRYTQVDLAAQAQALSQFMASAFPDAAAWEK